MVKISSAADDGHLALFADILGFGNLVESMSPTELDQFRFLTRLDFPGPYQQAADSRLPLFASFHSTAVRICSELPWKDKHHLIMFSDSYYLVSTERAGIFSAACRLMRQYLQDAVPVRMGIGAGSFMLCDFVNEEGKDSSRNSARFFGTSIVRAYRAEASGLKGLRIFLAPQALHAFTEAGFQGTIPLDSAERSPFVAAELNYVEDPVVDFRLFDLINSIGASAPAAAREHYHRTFFAVERMFAAHGRRLRSLRNRRQRRIKPSEP